MEVRVLSLVTNERARFYRQQVDALRERGVEVDTISIPGRRHAGDDSIQSRSPLDYARFYGTALRAAADHYDVVHASYGLTAPVAVVQSNAPSVVTLWGSDLMGTYGPISKLSARGADEVIVMSTEMAEALGRPCTVIPHGIDTERFAPADQAAAREELGWDDGHQVLFPYSPNRPIKNFPRAERVVAAAERRLGEPVTLQTVSGVPHEEMPTYMNAADALLLTSDREGSPNSVKEALACNLPVVSRNVGDVAERLHDVEPSVVGDTDPELVDGLVEILERGERSNGRVMVDDIDLETQVDRLYDIYRRAAGA